MVFFVDVVILNRLQYRRGQFSVDLHVKRVHFLSFFEVQPLEHVVLHSLLDEIEVHLVGYRTVGCAFVICLEIVGDYPFGSESLLGQGAGAVDDHWFFLEEEGVADAGVVGVEAEIDAEAGDHAREYGVVHLLAVNEFELDGVHEVLDGLVTGVEFEVFDDFVDFFDEFFGLEEGLLTEVVAPDPGIEFLLIPLAMVELAVDVAKIEEITFVVRKLSVFDLVYLVSQVYVPHEQIRGIYHHTQNLNHIGLYSSQPLQLFPIPLLETRLLVDEPSLPHDVLADQCLHDRPPKKGLHVQLQQKPSDGSDVSFLREAPDHLEGLH